MSVNATLLWKRYEFCYQVNSPYTGDKAGRGIIHHDLKRKDRVFP